MDKQSGAGPELACEISATAASPLVNLCLLIENWGTTPAMVRLNGKSVAAAGAATGSLTTLEGDYLVVWLRVAAREMVSISLAAK